MATDTKIKQQIYQIIESLPVERLPNLLRFLRYLLQSPGPIPPHHPAPIYQVHHHAVDTGIPDLAAQHDHYLYGVSKEMEDYNIRRAFTYDHHFEQAGFVRLLK